MRSARGQGTVEYLAIVLLVAFALGGGTAAVASAAGADIATAVPHEVLRALCIVTRGDCDRDRAPCDVDAKTKSRSWAVTAAVFKGGHDKSLAVVRRSDGTYALTLDTAPGGGFEGNSGARLKVNLGHRTIDTGAHATFGVTGSYGHHRTWILPDKGAAERLKRAIEDGDALPPATVDGHEASVEGGADASVGSAVTVSGSALARLGGGWLTDHSSGNRTYFFDASVAGGAKVSLTGVDTTASVSGSDSDRYALTLAPDGRWLDLSATRTGALSAKADLPSDLAPIAGMLDVPTAGARRWVTESHLDLSDPQSLAAAQTLVARLRDPRHAGSLAAAVAALSRRMREAAVVDARTYAVDTETQGADGRVVIRVPVGGKYTKTTENTRLIAATTRGLNGRWDVRDDCMEEATR